MNDVEALRTLASQVEAVFQEVRYVDDRYILLKMPSGRMAVVYLLNVSLPASVIRRSLRDNTKQGIHSLFVLHIDLLPTDGATVRLDPLLNMLQIIYHGQIYTYHREAEMVSIIPVQVRATE